MSLDRMHDYLAWNPNELPTAQQSMQVQVIRVVALVAAKIGAAQADRDVIERLEAAMLASRPGTG